MPCPLVNFYNFMQKLLRQEKNLLRLMTEGSMLRSHRDLDGNKSYQLNAPDGSQSQIKYKFIKKITRKNYISSNQKFPVATFSLTQKGKNAVEIVG